MRSSVRRSWPIVCERWEGRLSWMYLDTKGLVTTGTGNLIDPITVAQGIPWYKANGDRASVSEVASEWRRVKALTSLKSKSGWAYESSARLHLDDITIDGLLFSKTEEFWTRLARTVKDLETVPADAQLALLDLSWQNGPAFLDAKKSNGDYVWSNMRPAVLSGDWDRAADAVPGDGDRTKMRSRLFRNAAQVIELDADPDVLWNLSTPTPRLNTSKGHPLMANSATQIYKRSNLKDQVFGPGEHILKINNENGDTSLVTGPNDGVAITVGVNVSSEKGGVLRMVLVDYKKGEETTIHHKRVGQSFAAGEHVEVLTRFDGSIGKAKVDGHTLRLRIMIESDGNFTAHDVQSTGFTL